MMAEYTVQDRVGIICIDNPPINLLKRKTCTAICQCVERSAKDDTIAVVIFGKGGHFCAGVDISSLDALADENQTSGRMAVEALEMSNKPVVAAIAGHAVGGGFEIALGCHYRVATAGSVVGFPEVTIGLLPAAGGTQRFPRLVRLDHAMAWISSGKLFSGQVAKSIGAIDAVVEDKSLLLPTALQLAKEVANEPLLYRRISALPVKDSNIVDEIAAKYLSSTYKKSSGQHSPVACIQAVKFAASSTFWDGMQKEAELFRTCVTSGQCRALIHSFFGEKQVSKWSVPGTAISWRSAKPMHISSAAVIGLGTMGSGIAINFLRAGIPVIVKEQNAEYLAAGMKLVHSEIDKMGKRGKISLQQSLVMKDLVTGTEDYRDLSDVDIVIEAVYEEIEVKKQVFEALDKVCKPSAILATNTGGLDVDEIASFTSRPRKVMATHFFAPPHLMRLLENIYGRKTSSETIATCMELGKRMGKVAVLVRNCYLFVSNRMYVHYMNECDFMLEEGAYPHVIDKALTDFGFAMGRFLVGDISGNDVLFRGRRSVGLTVQRPGDSEVSRKGIRYCALSDILCSKGRYGTKVGKGWYDYRTPSVPEVSPEIQQMIDDYRKRNLIAPRYIDVAEVLERALYPLINEGFKVLGDGVASSPADIDQIWIHGYAWPKHTGGPMFYAHTVGLPKLLRRIQYYYSKHGDKTPHWCPSKMLVRIVAQRGNPPMDEWMQFSEATMNPSVKSSL